MDRQASGAERNPTTQSGEPQTREQNTGEQRTGEVVKLEVGGPFDKLGGAQGRPFDGAQGRGKMVECRIERVLDLEAPQVMLTVCREIASQKVVLRVVSRHGAATVEMGAVGSNPSKMMEAAHSLEEEMDKANKRLKKATVKKPLAPSTSADRPARRRRPSSR